jgi:hypothetical protein
MVCTLMWISRDFSTASCFMNATIRLSSLETCSSLRPCELDMSVSSSDQDLSSSSLSSVCGVFKAPASTFSSLRQDSVGPCPVRVCFIEIPIPTGSITKAQQFVFFLPHQSSSNNRISSILLSSSTWYVQPESFVFPPSSKLFDVFLCVPSIDLMMDGLMKNFFLVRARIC